MNMSSKVFTKHLNNSTIKPLGAVTWQCWRILHTGHLNLLPRISVKRKRARQWNIQAEFVLLRRTGPCVLALKSICNPPTSNFGRYALSMKMDKSDEIVLPSFRGCTSRWCTNYASSTSPISIKVSAVLDWKSIHKGTSAGCISV